MRGSNDHIGDRSYLIELAARQTTFEEVVGADHHVAITSARLGLQIVHSMADASD